MNIGMKVKMLRTERGITLKDLSEKSKLSIGFLSQLERGMSSIAIDSLEILSEIFDVPLTYFLDYPNKKQDKILRSYEQEIIDIEDGSLIYYGLSSNLKDKVLFPRLIEILPSSKEEEIIPYSHEGEEFVYVLEGVLTVYLNGERYDIYPGDSVHLNSKIDHNWANYTNKKVKIITVNTPNLFK